MRVPPSMRLLTYPNAVTVLRFPLAVAFVFTEGVLARAAIIAAGAFSDWLDGWLSRRLEQASGFGELVDPLADKVFVLVILGTFWVEARIDGWELALLVARDAYNMAGFAVAKVARLPLRFRSRGSGKMATALQLATALMLLLLPPAGHALVWVAGLAGLAAIADYTAAGVRALRPPSGAA